jgi:hypothetical protein
MMTIRPLRRRRYLLVGIALLQTLTAGTLASASSLTGARVSFLCSKQPDSASYLILGISQGILAVQTIDAALSPSIPPRICYGPTATGAKVIEAVCNYVASHAEYATADIGLIALTALREAFPCR